MSRKFMIGLLMACAGLTAGCETDVQREMRQEREALEKSGELEELEGQLDTVNPDPYARKDNRSKGNLGRHKRN